MTRARLWAAFSALAGCWIAALLHRGQLLSWDEIEFFRASRWIALGRVPYRDFWEHHTPLQWFLFAPLARFADGPGAASIVAMRWAQVLLWIATLAVIFMIMRRVATSSTSRLAGLALLLASPSFVRYAIEFRVDVPGNLAWFSAILLVSSHPRSHLRWVAFGALMSCAAIANMRLVPLIVATALLLHFWRADEERWSWNGRAPWMFAGVAAIAAPFVGFMAFTGSLLPFFEQVIRMNLGAGLQQRYDTFWVTILNPIATGDVAGVAVWLLGLSGAAISLRSVRRPGLPQILAILLFASVLSVWTMAIHYPYHFQQTFLLLLPLAALALERLEPTPRWARLAACIVAFALAMTLATELVDVASPGFGNELRYQDRVMTEVDRRTSPSQTVFDGCGYALRRQPAYRYWFLTIPVRVQAYKGLIEPYDVPQMASKPPAALVYNLRMHLWFQIYPRLGEYAVAHYVPLYRNLWIPGFTGRVAGRGRIAWRVQSSGRYAVHASEALSKHPWFTDPLRYGRIQGTEAAKLAIVFSVLPPLEKDALRWSVDGVVVDDDVHILDLEKGSVLEVVSSLDRAAGLLVVPEGIEKICVGPDEVFVF